jgi:hypothetical protein
MWREQLWYTISATKRSNRNGTRSPEPKATNPKLALVAAEELVLIETYLHRRVDMDPTLRDQVACKIASRIAENTGLQRDPNQSLDEFLEASALQIRDSARFR